MIKILHLKIINRYTKYNSAILPVTIYRLNEFISKNTLNELIFSNDKKILESEKKELENAIPKIFVSF